MGKLLKIIVAGFITFSGLQMNVAHAVQGNFDHQQGGFLGIGEVSQEGAIINCRCANLINKGLSAQDLTCANFKRATEAAILTPGGVTNIATPAQGPNQHAQ